MQVNITIMFMAFYGRADNTMVVLVHNQSVILLYEAIITCVGLLCGNVWFLEWSVCTHIGRMLLL
jgi:hypothetical protein